MNDLVPPSDDAEDPTASDSIEWSIERNPNVDYDAVERLTEAEAEAFVPAAGEPNRFSRAAAQAKQADINFATLRSAQLLGAGRRSAAFASFQLILMTPVSIFNLVHGRPGSVPLSVIIVGVGVFFAFEARRYYKGHNELERRIFVQRHELLLGRNLTVEEFQAGLADPTTLPTV